MAFYVDTSALVKLVIAEDETDALLSWLQEDDRRPVACDLVRTELLRAVRRAAPDRAVQARAVLDRLTLLTAGPATYDAAGTLDPPALRSLDAVHLASALSVGDDLDGLVTYDDRLADVARAHGVPVVAPGA